MTTIDLQTYLDPELYALFAKASYCKTRNDIATTAIVAMHDWLDYKYSNWGVIAENQGINGFQAVAYGKDINKDGIYEEVVIAYRGTDSFLDLFGDDFEKLNIAGTYNLLYNAAIMTEDKIGYALGLDRLIADTLNSPLTFRPLNPKLEVAVSIAWKKNQVFSKPASLFLEELQDKFQ